MKLELSGGKNPEHEGYETQQRLVNLFQEILLLQAKKGFTYGDAWRSQGYMGNVARVLSKVSRLRKMIWTDTWNQIESTDETTEDTLLDLINLAAFALINKRDGNKWGNGI